jgi:thiosulfate dehydrogenase (quinone) large subunit
MPKLTTEHKFILAFRLLMAWTFLYAASHQIFNSKFSAVAFLQHTKTFHDIYAPIALPSYDPILTFLVGYGHLLIGLSLLVGLCVRLSGVFGLLLLMMYWTAHMDWPYIENANNFIVDYHIVYSFVLAYLIHKSGGHVCGLDKKVSTWAIVQNSALLRFICA